MRQAIDKAKVRNELQARREPYWGAPLSRGLFLGFRKGERGGSWVARWRDDDGRQHYQALGAVGPTNDHEDARRAALAWHRKRLAGMAKIEAETIEAVCAAYVDALRDAGREAAAHDAHLRFEREVYKRKGSATCEPERHEIGRIKPAKITEKDITKWRDVQAKRLSPASVNRTLTALKAALNLAVRNREIEPARAIEWRNVKPCKIESSEGRRTLYLDRVQRRALIDAASGAVRDLIEAAALTGARPGELVSATRAQFESRTGMLTLSGKTGARTIPLSPPARDLFTRLARGKLPAARLLTRDDGKPWAPSDWDGLVRDAAERAGLPAGVCLYTLRHSWITAALTDPDHALSTLEVGKLVGTSLLMIDRNYGHLATKSAQEKLAKLEIA